MTCVQGRSVVRTWFSRYRVLVVLFLCSRLGFVSYPSASVFLMCIRSALNPALPMSPSGNGTWEVRLGRAN